jgi:Asp-tRNA(Asn)/Glu-tRNA(Gln) amidotransferase A subunit family amidase
MKQPSRSAEDHATPDAPSGAWTRRRLLQLGSAAGAGATFGRALVALAAEKPALTRDMIRQAQWISGIDLKDDEVELMLKGTDELLADFAKLRLAPPLDNGVPPALSFRPAGDGDEPAASSSSPATPIDSTPGVRPSTPEDLAFAPLTELAALVRARRVSSVELTRLYLERLRRHGDDLKCVVSLTEELALQQAERADRELAAGRYRGPLHGIPWGAKDLLSVPGYPTTWGAKPFESQVRPETATVVSRLEAAGAVLVAKLSLGALAWGDVWYGGKTLNPWNPEQGSSGSSAGPAAATAAGLVGFSIGSETWGSIVSPCTRCGTTGLRPTFGSVSRHGAMALSWSMDKLGPITRSVEDCALIFDAIRGPDGLDPTVVKRPFAWPPRRDLRTLKVGYLAKLFDEDRGEDEEDAERRQKLREWQEIDRQSLETLRGLGLQLQPIALPEGLPVEQISFILTAEAATAFDELTRSGRDDLLVRQVDQAWPNVFRQGQLIPAVEYLRANRIRTLVLEEMEQLMSRVDVYVSPSFGGDNLLRTNLTGHPCVVVPNGFRPSDGTPTSITFGGRLHGETDLLAVAHAFQQATDFHLQRPPLGAPPASSVSEQ